MSKTKKENKVLAAQDKQKALDKTRQQAMEKGQSRAMEQEVDDLAPEPGLGNMPPPRVASAENQRGR